MHGGELILELGSVNFFSSRGVRKLEMSKIAVFIVFIMLH